ncbi:hypothetical protein [Pseudoalteromonas arctica]|uniref:Uncharacterized protein n=1 Tax=Pseudoalteromonas arctica TaxID=394751 RepID=A0A7Y0HDP2_9GAMM|nr:hypothetical protein [Pseudoalteromonas arctica]NMM42653.1 hypothetical protein [Pseudoalteromonas arctica]
MTKIAWYKKPEMIVALSALLISVVTTIIGIYSTMIDRSYARASVWPRVELFRSFSPEKGHFSYGVMNNGTGPAVIKYAKITHNDKPVKKWSDFIVGTRLVQSHIGTRILPSQANISAITIKDKAYLTEILKMDEQIAIELCYCSIYDECWMVDRSNQPIEIAHCEISDEQRFMQ